MPQYASVYILDLPFALDRPFDYYIPPDMRQRIRIGGFVTVPFGGGNRHTIALVSDLSETCSYDEDKVKPIASLCSEELFLSEKLIGLALYMKEQTLCTMGEAVHSMIPSAAFSRLVEYYRPTDKEGYPKSKEEITISLLNFIREKKVVSESTIRGAFGAIGKEMAERLSTAGYITRETVVKNAGQNLTKSRYSITISSVELCGILSKQKGYLRITSEGQLKALDAICKSTEPLSEEELMSIGATRANLRSLCKKGLIKEEKTIIYRDPYDSYDKEAVRSEIKLNSEQSDALDILIGLADSGKASAALLHGVTGSGKTSVMTALIDKMLQREKSVIMLLPEISLTPQTISIFKGRYGSICTVVHSALSIGERYDAYLRINSGEARVVIGTRSAVFSPVRDLGLIIIDEEQEQTY
ncbi:MAG: DEAD/DEAH box helicase family protein, partial [Clostridia bacterium]|nr:DEAD/DEAH box helicase family protein [Clostridia bacterium]